MKQLPSSLLLISSLVLFATFSGCGPKEEEGGTEVTPQVNTEFKGSVDTKMVGEWATKDKQMHLTLSADGKARMQSTVGTRLGPQKIDSALEWKVDGATISFKDTNGAISRYECKSTATELELKSPKSVTTYIKQ